MEHHRLILNYCVLAGSAEGHGPWLQKVKATADQQPQMPRPHFNPT